jgi:hypothetical protein
MKPFWDIFFGFLAVLAGIVATVFLTLQLSMRRMPASHRIAVVGFPQTGKTTLITAVFAYFFRHGVKGASIVPRGDETIRRINANMELLELGRPIGPTTDQDVFAYRAEVDLKSAMFPRRYKLEIGDFPGESTVEFSEEYQDWLHLTRYFEWAVSADAFLFVVDVGAVLLDEDGEYVARQKRALRAAWQRLQESHLEGSSDVSLKPLVLVFTKADVLLFDRDISKLDEIPPEGQTPIVSVSPHGLLARKTEKITDRFEDLIQYFQNENRRFAMVFTSVFINVEGERLGVPEIAQLIMPRASSNLVRLVKRRHLRRIDPERGS